MKIQDVHAMAMAAAARGWIGHEEVWAIACRWASHGGTPVDPHDIFARILDTDKLRTLSTEHSAADTQAGVLVSMPPASERFEEMPGRVAGPRYTLREPLGSGGASDV